MYKRINHDFTETSEYNILSKKVQEIVGKRPSFEFSIIKSVDDGKDEEINERFYVNHPNLESGETILKGKVQFGTDYWRVNETKRVCTPVLNNPTWKDVLVATNNLLEENNAGGIFLEALTITGETNGIKQVELEFGS